MENIYTVFITMVTTLGGASAWRFYEKRASKKEENDLFIRHDCQTRIAKLEALLEESSKEKDEMRKTILHLSTELAALRVKIELMENQR